MMSRSLPILLMFVAAGESACESSPTAPIVTPAPSVPAVATAKPLIWDSPDELSAWVTHVSTGDAAVIGTDIDAVIRVDIAQQNAKLHGPDLDPALGDVQTVRMRYRWVDRGANDRSLSLFIYLREPGASVPDIIPRLAPPVTSSAIAEFQSGVWIERTFTSQIGSIRPPFRVRFALVDIGTSFVTNRNLHGAIEIDWIALTADAVR
jgi:hypothetical protein